MTVTVRDSAASDRLRAVIDLFLPADRGYLVVRPHLQNPMATALGYKFWLNAMLAPGADNRPSADLEFIFNAAEVAIHSTGDDRLPGHTKPLPALIIASVGRCIKALTIQAWAIGTNGWVSLSTRKRQMRLSEFITTLRRRASRVFFRRTWPAGQKGLEWAGGMP